MTTPNPSDPRALAHRLTTIGHALHHRLFAHLHDSGIHPKTLLLLGAVDGRIDAPWVADRLARGGKRVTALADRGWIVRADDGTWSLTDDGRALLDRADAERSALLNDVPAEQLAALTTALDALAETLGIDDETAGPGPRGRFRVTMGGGRRGFGPDPRRAFGPNEHHGFRVGDRGSAPRRPMPPGSDRGAHDGSATAEDGRPDLRPGTHDASAAHEDGHGGHPRHREDRGCGGPRHHRRRGDQRAFERGFDAGFRHGRDAGGTAPDPRA